jgi:hypothetical protein
MPLGKILNSEHVRSRPPELPFSGFPESAARALGARLLRSGTLQREGDVLHVIATQLIDLSTWTGTLSIHARNFNLGSLPDYRTITLSLSPPEAGSAHVMGRFVCETAT